MIQVVDLLVHHLRMLLGKFALREIYPVGRFGENLQNHLLCVIAKFSLCSCVRNKAKAYQVESLRSLNLFLGDNLLFVT